MSYNQPPPRSNIVPPSRPQSATTTNPQYNQRPTQGFNPRPQLQNPSFGANIPIRQPSVFTRTADVAQKGAVFGLLALTGWAFYQMGYGYLAIKKRNREWEAANPELAEQIKQKLQAEDEQKRLARG